MLVPIDPKKPKKRRPDALQRMKRLYDLEKTLIKKGTPYGDTLWNEFSSIVEESNVGWDEAEKRIDEWETNLI
jgi:hypothetical protein